MTDYKTMEKEKHKTYDVRFMLKAVEVGKKSIASAAREFGVDRKRIREWTKQESELLKFKKDGKPKSKRLKGGRKALDEEMEETGLLTCVAIIFVYLE